MYKAEAYIASTIENILSQSCSDIELILVDDGSPDNSGRIAEAYALKDNRIRVIHKQNEGTAWARRDGILASTGEWIAFVDADDSLPKTALEDLYSMTSDDTDIVVGRADHRGFGQRIEIPITTYRKKLISRNRDYGFITALWGKLFRRSLFATIDHPKLKLQEDFIVNVRLAFATNKNVKIINKCVYHYYSSNPNGTWRNSLFSLDILTDIQQQLLDSIPKDLHKDYAKEILMFLYGDYAILLRRNKHNVWKQSACYIQLLAFMQENNISFTLEQSLLFSISDHPLHRLRWQLVRLFSRIIRRFVCFL